MEQILFQIDPILNQKTFSYKTSKLIKVQDKKTLGINFNLPFLTISVRIDKTAISASDELYEILSFIIKKMLLAFQNEINFNSTIFGSGDILGVSLVMFGYMVKNVYI